MDNLTTPRLDQPQSAPDSNRAAPPGALQTNGSDLAAVPAQSTQMVKVRLYPSQPAPLAGWLMCLGGAAMVAGTFMPWIWVPSGLLSTDRLYAPGIYAALMLLAAAAIMLAGGMVISSNSGRGRLIGALFAGAAGALALWTITQINLDSVSANELIVVTPDTPTLVRLVTSAAPGLYVILAGSYLALLATLLQRSRQRIIVLGEQ